MDALQVLELVQAFTIVGSVIKLDTLVGPRGTVNAECHGGSDQRHYDHKHADQPIWRSPRRGFGNGSVALNDRHKVGYDQWADFDSVVRGFISSELEKTSFEPCLVVIDFNELASWIS